MSEALKLYPGKILLFGEHTLLTGSDGLAIPATGFSGHWRMGHHQQDTDLFALANYLETHYNRLVRPIDISRFLQETTNGLIFDCNIPRGYGLGSSGAFTAGLYDRYGMGEVPDDKDLRADLGIIESFFHGHSSGLDPLVSYTGQAFHIHQGVAKRISLEASIVESFSLINTGMSRQASFFIALFKDRMKDPEFASKIEVVYLPVLEQAINASLADDRQTLNQAMFDISYFQMVWLSEFIPVNWIKIWEQRLASGHKLLKMLGAGGGGFLLEYEVH